MQDGCKVYMDSYTGSHVSCFMVTWIIFKNHLLEVGLTPKQETMALWTLTTVDLLYFIMYEDSHEQAFIEIAFGWRPRYIWLHTTLQSPRPHYMISKMCWDGLRTLSFGLSQLHGHRSWLMCEVARKYMWPTTNQYRSLFVQIQTLPPSMHYTWTKPSVF